MKLNLWGPGGQDNLRNRRNLAFFSAIFSLVIWPHELILLHFFTDLNIDLIKAMLVYVGTVAGTSIGGYIWSSMQNDLKEKAQDVGTATKKPD